MRTQTKEIQSKLTPRDAHRILVEGNNRFVQNLKAQRNLKEQVLATSSGQYPFAVVLSCIDSRVPAELVFDQGIGDMFSVRIAGNIINEDILGSMEYACKVSGAKILVVMGHSKCGAVTAAYNNIRLGNITSLLSRIEPAVAKVAGMKLEKKEEEIQQIANVNVKLSINEIRSRSSILAKMEEEGKIEIVGAMYQVESGRVIFFEE